jgi:hypothetical protein
MAKNNKQVESEKPTKSSSGFKVGFLVATAIFVVVILIVGVVFGGWWWYKKYVKESLEQAGLEMQNQADHPSQTQEKTYTNSYFGFSLSMTPSWKGYQTTEEKMGGDFEVGRIGFFLPTSQKDWMSPQMPGYFNAFTISAYVKDSWDEAMRVGTDASVMMSEEIGRNNNFVFAWSHFNGDPPSDVSSQSIRDMQTIVESIETFAPQMSGAGGAISDPMSPSGYSGWDAGTKPMRDADFDYDSIYYWNCKHSYTVNYPTAWSNNGMTSSSNTAILKGNKIQVQLEAISIPVAKTLQEFAEERAKKISGDKAWQEVVDWGNGTTVFRVTYINPSSIALWWIANSGYGMELKAAGSGYDNAYTTIQNLTATLVPNSPYIGQHCGSSSSGSANTSSQAKISSDCSFPNGDVEYWWDSASAAEKQCYVDKYGAPSFYEP